MVISAFYHDSAACVVVDGEIVAAAQEERFTRKSTIPGFRRSPSNTACGKPAGRRRDVDYVVFYEKPLRKFERLLETYVAYAPSGLRSFNMAIPVWLKEKFGCRASSERASARSKRSAIVFTDHHESHAASAFFPSPFDEAAILTLDGVGEWTTTTMGIGRGNRIELTNRIRVSAFARPAVFRVSHTIAGSRSTAASIS